MSQAAMLSAPQKKSLPPSSSSSFCNKLVNSADLAAIGHVPAARAMGIELGAMPRLKAWTNKMVSVPAVKGDREPLVRALAKVHDISSELVGPDGRIHWRDSRLEWPVRHGFIDFVAREFHGGRMMFPPQAT